MTMESPASRDYSAMPDAELLGLLFSEEDRLPAECAREAVARGARLIPALAGIVGAEKNWLSGPAEWWAVTHATFLLGAIGGKDAAAPLVKSLFHAVKRENDWINEELPSIFGNLGPDALAPLKELAADRSWDWYLRNRVMCGLAALALKQPQLDKEIFAFIAAVAADKTETPDTRGHAALILLDFLRGEYRELMLALAPEMAAARIFDAEDVNRAFARGKKDLYWYTRDWLDFYSREKIAERAARWEQEKLEDGGRDDWDDLEDEYPVISRKAALAHLGPHTELIRKARELIGLSERGRFKGGVEGEYALAMELCRALSDRYDDLHEKMGEDWKAREAGAEPPPAPEQGNPAAEAESMDPFQLFDIAVGRGRLVDWLTPLPMQLASAGLTEKGVELAEEWALITETENFLGDKALALAIGGLADRARAQIKENLERFEDSCRAHMDAGLALEELLDFNAAEALYRKALKLAESPSDRDDAADLLIQLLRRNGKGAEADALEGDRPAATWERPPWPETVKRETPKTGRNDPCPCGSGRKYKKCCLDKSVSRTEGNE
jgi:hypothetical protein